MACASLGRLAYAAYALSTGGRDSEGSALPAWDALLDGIRRAWDAASDAIVNDLNEAPHGRCAECFAPLVPLAHSPWIAMCPTHRPAVDPELPSAEPLDVEDSGAHLALPSRMPGG